MADSIGWNADSGTGTVGNTDYPSYRNKSGFSGLPGGHRLSNGDYLDGGYDGNWWSSTIAWTRGLGYNAYSVYWYPAIKTAGFSVRCLKD